MYTVTKFPHGAFSWADCVTTDAETAKVFYMELFGWGKVEAPMGEDLTYTMFQHQGQNVVALAPMQPEVQEMGIPSHWHSYVTVDDVDALASVVTDNGGSIMYGPFDVFDSGRMVNIQDPTGAAISLWQPRNHIGAGIVNTVGAMCWNELLTRDAARAKAFYSAVLGWEFRDYPHYTDIVNRGRGNGGIFEMDESFGDTPPCWMPYFNIGEINAGMARVKALGGQVRMGPTEAPNTGYWALATDPVGAHFYIIERFKTDPWEE